MKNQKKFITIMVFLLLVIGVLVLFLVAFPSSQPNPSPSVAVINPQGDTKIHEEERFSITFQPQFNKYVIFINAAPFEKVRKVAESTFLNLLRLTSDVACDLNVVLTTSRDVDEKFAGNEYRLSFCQNLVSSINPALPPLVVKKVFPEQGTLEAGGTNAGIAITFNKPVLPETVVVNSSPTLSFRVYIHPNRQNELYIEPTTNWEIGKTYQITIYKSLLSQDTTAQLKNDITLTYTVTEHIPADFEESFQE